MTTDTETGEKPEVQEAPDAKETTEPEGEGVTLAGLADKVDALARKVAGLGRRSSTVPDSRDGADVAGQVRSEVAKIRDAEARAKGREDRLGTLEAQIKQLAEKPPREYRRITKILWGDDEEPA